MCALPRKTRKFMHNRDGPTAGEYAVFLALMVLFYWAIKTVVTHQFGYYFAF